MTLILLKAHFNQGSDGPIFAFQKGHSGISVEDGLEAGR